MWKRGLPTAQLLLQRGELLPRQLRETRRTRRAQGILAALPPGPTPTLYRPLADPKVPGDHRSPLTGLEPDTGLKPHLLTKRPPLSGQAPTLRIPHTNGIPQGSRPVTTDNTTKTSVTSPPPSATSPATPADRSPFSASGNRRAPDFYEPSDEDDCTTLGYACQSHDGPHRGDACQGEPSHRIALDCAEHGLENMWPDDRMLLSPGRFTPPLSDEQLVWIRSESDAL